MNQRYSAGNGECSSREWTISRPDRSDVRGRFAGGQGLRFVSGGAGVLSFCANSAFFEGGRVG